MTEVVQRSLGTGRNSLQEGRGAGSGNFQLTAPVGHLPGRGLDLTLNFIYNSRLWQKAGSKIIFDIDADWPAPGWSLGFGKLVLVNDANSMLIDTDGTRHSFTGKVTDKGSGWKYFAGHTEDGTFIDYEHSLYLKDLREGKARYPNGTVVTFTAPGSKKGTLYPTRITDTNGNYLTIAYRNNTGPQIDTIIDTLGRLVRFHYDQEGLLTAITGPGLNGSTRAFIRLHYVKKPLQYAFKGNMEEEVPSSEPWLIDAIYYPATATGYWFGDGDSFSSYGMIAKVSERRKMGFTAASLNEQGTITGGGITRQKVYNYPLQPDPTLDDAPTYTTMTETWEEMDTAPAVTKYAAPPRRVLPTGSPRRVSVTYPDGTRSVQIFVNEPQTRTKPPGFDDGLLSGTETYDAKGTLLRKTSIKWQPGDYNSPRVERTEETDERGQTKVTEFRYDVATQYGPAHNQVVEERQYDYDGVTPLRTVRTQYRHGHHVHRHIFRLPKVVEIYDGAGTELLSRTEFEYDTHSLVDTPGVVQHDEAYNPHAPRTWREEECEQTCEEGRKPPCFEVCIKAHWETAYDSRTDDRGNITRVTTFADAARRTGEIVETRHYDITGNLVATSSPGCCEQASYSYTTATQYAYPTAYTRGAADPNGPRITTSASYDFNTGLSLSTTDANGHTARFIYSPTTLRPERVQWPTGASTTYVYDDDPLTRTETALDASGAVAAQTVTWLNGLGLVRRTETRAEGFIRRLVQNEGEPVFKGTPPVREEQLPRWSIIESQYDNLGRLWKQSRPFQQLQAPQWTEYFYDTLRRLIRSRAPDGSEIRHIYNEEARPSAASSSPGQTVREVTAWGRERWTLTDALGRLVSVVKPNPNKDGSVFTVGHAQTLYKYNALNQLVEVNKQPDSQVRVFKYDSLGRLTHQHLPEKRATLDDAGAYGGPGARWSDVFKYDIYSNPVSHTDARGIKIIYFYAGDPLNRLQSVEYDVSGVGDPKVLIAPAATIGYQYMTTGDVTRRSQVTTANDYREEYSYDGEGRLSSKTQIRTSQSKYPFVITYSYDSLNRVVDIIYPAQYGVTGEPRKSVHYDYDVAGQLRQVLVDKSVYAGEGTYNAAGQLTFLKVGKDGPLQTTEHYEYDAMTGLLGHQQVLRTGATLLDLSYSYVRPGTKSGQNGQVTRLLNNLDKSRSRGYEYDQLGRLTVAMGGDPSTTMGMPRWAQEYTYDPHGNRTGVTASGQTANGAPPPPDGLTAISYNVKTNRITTPGFAYDEVGNL